MSIKSKQPKTTIILSGLILFLFLSSCDRQLDCFCTEVFVTQMVQLVDQAGQPITDAEVTVVLTLSGRPIDCSPYHYADTGFYCILSDSHVTLLDVDGEEITVTFQKSGYRNRIETYLFNTDLCQCHINLVRGETLIVLESS